MARIISRAVLLVAIATAVAGCQSMAQKTSGHFLKKRMIEICGKEDEACLAAVDEQYDACEKKYAKEWSAYMNASPAKEDALLDRYLSRMFSCVVDKRGRSYFAYNPTKR